VIHAASRVFPKAFPLERLGALHGTDKVDEWHTHVGRTNAGIYDQYFKGWRRDRFSMLEIGVLDGASLRMWRSYFPKARITGLDIDPRVEAMAKEGFRILVGSQTDKELLAGTSPSQLRFVIDDGSHVNELTIDTFRYLFPQLPAGAIYVIEDTLPAYEPARIEWPGMKYNRPEVNLDNKREDIDALLVDLQHDCDIGGPERTVSFVHTWPGLVIIGRA
jgi:demethylmacrocin O-methyltransferase